MLEDCCLLQPFLCFILLQSALSSSSTTEHTDADLFLSLSISGFGFYVSLRVPVWTMNLRLKVVLHLMVCILAIILLVISYLHYLLLFLYSVSNVRQAQKGRHQPPSKHPESRKSTLKVEVITAPDQICATEQKHLVTRVYVCRFWDNLNTTKVNPKSWFIHQSSSSFSSTSFECWFGGCFSLAWSFNAFKSLPQRRWTYFEPKDTRTKLIF